MVAYEILPLGRLFTNVCFSESVIMARLEFIKRHCIEELTEQQILFGFSVRLSV